jgi:ferrous iron transport protein B
MRGSLGGTLGHALEPVLAPLGFDWRIGVGILGAFAAREVFVSTLGVVFGVTDADETDATLRSSLARATWPDGRRLMTPLVGVSLMVFFVLACQCMSTLAVVKRESGSWRWPALLFTYMTVVAWVASFLVFQIGRLLGLGVA